MHTFTYRKLPIIDRSSFLDECSRKGIALKDTPYEFRAEESKKHGIQTFRPVAIERRTYGDAPVALYAVIYRNVSTGEIRVKHAWGKYKNVYLPGFEPSVGESL